MGGSEERASGVGELVLSALLKFALTATIVVVVT